MKRIILAVIFSLVCSQFYGCTQQQGGASAPLSGIKSRAGIALDKYEAIVNEYDAALKKISNPADFQMKLLEFNERVSEWSKEWNSIAGQIASDEAAKMQERLDRLNRKVTDMCKPKPF